MQDRRVRLEARRVRRRRRDLLEDRRGGLLEGERGRVDQDLQARFAVGEEADVFFCSRRRLSFFSLSFRCRLPIVINNLSLIIISSLFHALSLGAARTEHIDPIRGVKVRRPEVGGVEHDGHIFSFFLLQLNPTSVKSIENNKLSRRFWNEECTLSLFELGEEIAC